MISGIGFEYILCVCRRNTRLIENMHTQGKPAKYVQPKDLQGGRGRRKLLVKG